MLACLCVVVQVYNCIMHRPDGFSGFLPFLLKIQTNSVCKAAKTVNHTIIVHNGDCSIPVPVHYIAAGAAKAKCKGLRVLHFSIIQYPNILYAGS